MVGIACGVGATSFAGQGGELLDLEGACLPSGDSLRVKYCHFHSVVFVDGRIGVCYVPFVLYLCNGGCTAICTGRGQWLGLGRLLKVIFQPIGPGKQGGSLLVFSLVCFHWLSLSAGTSYAGNVEN